MNYLYILFVLFDAILAFNCAVKKEKSASAAPSLPQPLLHTAPWVDGSVGRPLSTPPAQCAAPHFWRPAQFVSYIPISDLSFLCCQWKNQGCHRKKNNKTAGPCCSHCPTVQKQWSAQ